MLCEECMNIIKARSALSIPQGTKQIAQVKKESNTKKTNIAQIMG